MKNIDKVRHNFFDTSVADILRAIDGKSLLGSLILTFCCIDHMAQGHKPGEKTDNKDYKKCVSEIMGKLNFRYEDISEHIYAIRNSLIHSYGQSESAKKLNLHFLVSVDKFKEKHLKIVKKREKNVLLIDLPLFVAEVICSVDLFFNLFRNKSDVILKWHEMQIHIPKNKTKSKSLANYHRHLHYFDKNMLLPDVIKLLSEDIRSDII